MTLLKVIQFRHTSKIGKGKEIAGRRGCFKLLLQGSRKETAWGGVKMNCMVVKKRDENFGYSGIQKRQY